LAADFQPLGFLQCLGKWALRLKQMIFLAVGVVHRLEGELVDGLKPEQP
jgi:hypothetical protein